jgi:hypothetical protein
MRPLDFSFAQFGDYAMFKWIRKRVSKETPTKVEIEEDSNDVEEKFAPVGVRVKPFATDEIKPADTYVAGYNVDEDRIGVDDEHSTTVNNIKTTGVNPYDTGFIDSSNAEKPVPEKQVR